jgi:predicted solute-binding protein
MAKRLGIVPHLYAQPLVHGLKYQRNAAAGNVFEYVEDQYAQLALQLRQGKLDGAFLSPIEYAKEYRESRIIPRIGVVSEGESQSVLLVFNEQIRKLQTVAVDPAFPSEIVLTNIVLKEKYDTTPQFIPITGTIDEAFTKADAVLAVDREAFAVRGIRNKLDLVDEWFDLTEMSFVHGMWVVRENALTTDDVNGLIASVQPAEALHEVDSEGKEYLGNFRYELDDEAVASLNEFFRMAYYHGILTDIPDVRTVSLENS